MASRAPDVGLGIPKGLKFFSPYPFSGMNLQAAGPSIADQEFLWLENFLRVGDGNLRTAWDRGSALYTATGGRSIIMHFWYTIGTAYYAAVFLSDGSAVQITTSGVTTQIGPPGTFYSAANGQLPACTQWGTLYLLISNRNTNNDYWAWDGSILYHSGTAAPQGVTLLATGSQYTSLPTVTAYGGSGFGMVVVPTINAGGVVNLQITNPGTGYEVGDTVQLAFAGGGSDDSAILVAGIDLGGISAASITNGGSGYTTATVAFAGGGGSGAAGTAIIGSGVSSIAVTNGGSGYTTANVTFSGGGGSGAAGTATISGGQITNISVDIPGSGYTSAPTVAIAGDGTGAAATAAIQNGVITGITITNSGSGYSTVPIVTITGDGTGATAQAFLNPGSVQDVEVVNPGTNFTYAPDITFVGGGGTGATGIAVLQPTSVARVNVTAGGSGYIAPPTVQFFANEGATLPTGTAIMNGDAVMAVELTDGGSGITTNVGIVFNTGFTGKAKDGTLQIGPGTGATAQAILSPTGIGSVTISSAGKQYTSAPAVEVGSGANNAAYATVELMPFGVSGSAMETYQQRVWIVNPAPPQFGTLPPGGNFQVSAPGSITDFATGDGGVQFTNSDGFLQTQYVGIRQSNGYLYIFGDGSVSIISSVNTSGDPATTTFNYQNVDPQTGLAFRDSMQDFSKTILFSNQTGVYGLYGGSATLASVKLRDLFNDAIFPPSASALLPSSAVATLFDMKHYLMLMTVKDPDTLAYRNVMVTWNEKEWSITSQTTPLTYIATQKVGSRLTAWGTDGTSLFPLFASPSASLVKRLDTKLYGGGSGIVVIQALKYFHLQAQDKSAALVGIDCDLQLFTSGQAVQPLDAELATVLNNAFDSDVLYYPVSFAAPPPFWPVSGTGMPDLPFFVVGARLSTTSPDFAISNFMMGYADMQAFVA